MRLWQGLRHRPARRPRHREAGRCQPQGAELARRQEALAAQGFAPLAGTPQEFDAFYRKERDKWAKVIQRPAWIRKRRSPRGNKENLPKKGPASKVSGRRALLARTGAMRERLAMYNANVLKIGMFGANCSSSRTATKAPERWSASWPDCLALARMADDAGIDFMLPIGRWKGYGGDTDFHGTTLETMTWACGLLAATKRITVFGTVHAPLFNPVIAAKEFVTADHIGEGRFGLNIVAGWNEGEFEMFGVSSATTRRATNTRRNGSTWSSAPGPSRAVRFRGPVPQAQRRARVSQAVRRHAAADHERRLVGHRAGLRAAQLRRVLHRHAAIAHIARGRRSGSPRSRARRAAGPRDRGLHHRPGDLPADPEGGRRVLPPRQHRERRLGRDRADAGAARHHAAEHAPRNTGQAAIFRRQLGRRLSVRRHAGQGRRGARRYQPRRRARHRGLVRQLSRRAAVFCDEVLPRLERMGVREPN